jgi:sporulation protein YlmC with PRC-barrel domain
MDNNENLNRKNTLEELGGSDYKIVDGQPNIKGWEVKDQLGRDLGDVDELLFDPESQKVRYIVLDLDDNELDLEDRKVLIPIGLAQLHEEDDDVILPDVTVEQLSALPAYDFDSFTSDVEKKIYSVFSGNAGLDVSENSSLYEHDYYNESNLMHRRHGNHSSSSEQRQTVIGIFENGFDAQNAITALTSSGFSKDQVDISSRNEVDSDEENDNGISSFFGNLFSNHDEASRYSEIAKRGSVVTVHAQSSDEALRAAEILDQHGAKDVDEGYNNPSESTDNDFSSDRSNSNSEQDYYLNKNESDTSGSRTRSKIFNRSIDESSRLRSESRDWDSNNNR